MIPVLIIKTSLVKLSIAAMGNVLLLAVVFGPRWLTRARWVDSLRPRAIHETNADIENCPPTDLWHFDPYQIAWLVTRQPNDFEPA